MTIIPQKTDLDEQNITILFSLLCKDTKNF